MNRVKEFCRSFSHAMRGLRHALKNEKNFQTEIFLGLLVIAAMIFFDVTRGEAVALLLVITGILIMELFNTAVERVVDILKPRIHPYARLVKDLMAAAVLIASIFAVTIGTIIFLPYIFKFFIK